MRKLALMLAILPMLLWAAEAGAQQKTRRKLVELSRDVQFRYNRVEGLFLGYRLQAKRPAWKGLNVFVEVGHGLHNGQPRWEGGADYSRDRTSVSFAVFDRTETADREIIRTGENTIFALLFKGDYRDYYRTRNGFEARGAYRYTPRLTFLGRLTAFTYASMPVEMEWSIFRRGRDFRDNPRVRPGDAALLQLGFILNTRRRSPIFQNGWYVNGLYERGFREFGYDGLTLLVKRYQKLIFGEQAVVVQGRLGTRESAHEQHLFDLGGVSTLRGYGIKEFTGNRMLMLNFEYLFRGDCLGRIPLKGFHLLNAILFFDTGWISTVPGRENFLEGFGGMHPGDFKSNVGVAVALTQQLLRVNLARRLDGGDNTWVVSVRFRRKL